MGTSPSFDSGAFRLAWLGSVNALTVIAVVLTLSLVACAPLGADAARVGIPAAFAAVVAGGLAYALSGTAASPAGGPSSATSLIVAGLVAELVADPAFAHGSARGLRTIWFGVSAAVVLMGVLQALVGALGFGRLARFVPRPVLAGFMNGVALSILINQLPPLLGLKHAVDLGPSMFDGARPLSLVVGLGTAAVYWLTRAFAPRAPASLVALVLGSLLYLALTRAGFAPQLGSLIGALPSGVVVPDALLGLFDDDVRALLVRHAHGIVVTAVVLMLIGTLESMLAALAIDQLAKTRHDPRRELVSLGAANVVSGLCGGLPLVLLRARGLLLIEQRAAGRVPIVAGSLAFAAMYAFGAPVLALLPVSVLAGIMVTIAVALIDRWTPQLLRQMRAGESSTELRISIFVIAAVCIVTVTLGFVWGVVAGVLLSMVILIRSLNRSLVRSRCSAAERPSRRVWSPPQADALRAARGDALVLELEGALFFGSAERLQRELDAAPATTAAIVLDLRRVTTIDESGAMVLQSTSDHLRGRGTALLLAGVAADERHGRSLRAFGCFRDAPRADWFADADHATEAAERLLLVRAGVSVDLRSTVPLEDCTLLSGLTPAQASQVLPLLQRIELGAGERLFAEGDPGDRLFVLTEGSISIVSRGARAAQRFVSFSPGVMLGELAMLDGRGRTADAVADVASVLHALSGAAFERLAAADPLLGTHLMRNIALHLADRLRSAGAVWQASGA